jgi:hypothetical protein
MAQGNVTKHIPLKYPTAWIMFAPYLSIFVMSEGSWGPGSYYIISTVQVQLALQRKRPITTDARRKEARIMSESLNHWNISPLVNGLSIDQNAGTKRRKQMLLIFGWKLACGKHQRKDTNKPHMWRARDTWWGI